MFVLRRNAKCVGCASRACLLRAYLIDASLSAKKTASKPCCPPGGNACTGLRPVTPSRSHFVLPPIQLASLATMKNVPTAPIAQYAIARGPYSGAHAEFAAEMRVAEKAGHTSWCRTLRELHEDDLAARAPVELLKEFAAAAPSAYLLGYLFGFINVRESPEQYSSTAESMVRNASRHTDAGLRGALLGGAFMMIISGH